MVFREVDVVEVREVEFGGGFQSGAGCGSRDEVDDDFVACHGLATPVHRDLTEQPVFNLG